MASVRLEPTQIVATRREEAGPRKPPTKGLCLWATAALAVSAVGGTGCCHHTCPAMVLPAGTSALPSPPAQAQSSEPSAAQPTECSSALESSAPAEPVEAAPEIDATDDAESIAADADEAPQPALPERLSRKEISEGMRTVLADVKTCGEVFRYEGVLTARIEIAADGRVTSAVARTRDRQPAPDPSFVQCVEQTLRRARFEPAINPVTLTYPLMFMP